MGTVAAGPPEALPCVGWRHRDWVAAEVSAHGSGWWERLAAPELSTRAVRKHIKQQYCNRGWIPGQEKENCEIGGFCSTKDIDFNSKTTDLYHFIVELRTPAMPFGLGAFVAAKLRNCQLWARFGVYVGLPWPISTHLEPQDRKNEKATKCCKTHYFLGRGQGRDPSLAVCQPYLSPVCTYIRPGIDAILANC